MDTTIFVKKREPENTNSLLNDTIELCAYKISGPNLSRESYTNNKELYAEDKDIPINSCDICKKQCLEVFELVKALNKKIDDMTPIYQDNSSLVRRISKLERKIINLSNLPNNRPVNKR